MSRLRRCWSLALICLFVTFGCGPEPPPPAPPAAAVAPLADPLPSWNEGAAKKSIVDFVARVTREGGPDFVPPPERIATLDNDGTLWSEKPVPFQVVFAFDRVKALAPQHPEWKTREPFASLLKGDMAGVAASGEKGVLAIMAATHAGMTTDEFSARCRTGSPRRSIRKPDGSSPGWSTSRCWKCSPTCAPTGSRPSSSPAAASSSCGPWTERVYGIPPEQVVGSSGKLKLEMRNGMPCSSSCRRSISSTTRKASRSASSDRSAAVRSRRSATPTATCRCCSGRWPAPGARFALFVHHDDAAREFAYDRTDKLQQFNKGWDEAVAKGWTVVSMKDDWKTVFPPASATSK